MKLSVSRETFLARLSIVARAASTRSAIQTLAGVLIKLEDGRAELQATDTDLGIRAGFDAEIASEGSVVVPGRLLLDVARSLPEVRGLAGVPPLRAGRRGHLRLGQVPPAHAPARGLPQAPRAGLSSALALPAQAFVETIGRVARSASRDETRPHLTGVLVTADGADLRMVATDSYRLSVKETKLEPALDGSLEANVPARTLQELSRVVATDGDEQIASPHSRTRWSSAPGTWCCPRAGRWSIPELPAAAARGV